MDARFSTEFHLQAVVSRKQWLRQSLGQHIRRRIQRLGEMRQIHLSSILEFQKTIFQEHVRSSLDQFRAGMGEKPEILIVIHAHRGFHDESGQWIAHLAVIVETSILRPHRHDSASICGIKHSRSSLFQKVNQSLFTRNAGAMISWQGSESYAIHLVRPQSIYSDNPWHFIACLAGSFFEFACSVGHPCFAQKHTFDSKIQSILRIEMVAM